MNDCMGIVRLDIEMAIVSETLGNIPEVMSRSKGAIIVLQPQERTPDSLTESRSLHVRRLHCCKVADVWWLRYGQCHKATHPSTAVHGELRQ